MTSIYLRLGELVDADVDVADGAAPVGGAALGSGVGDRGRAEDGGGGG